MGDFFATPQEREDAKCEATARVLSHADPDWTDAAWAWLEERPTYSTVTSDDLTAAVGMPHHPNAVGAILTAAARERLLVKTGRYVPGRRVTCRGAVLAVWERTPMQRPS